MKIVFIGCAGSHTSVLIQKTWTPCDTVAYGKIIEAIAPINNGSLTVNLGFNNTNLRL